jgi:putative copper export protein
MTEMLLLRLIHVVGGAFWVGAMFFFVIFLEPTMRRAGPEGGRMMMRMAMSKFPPTIALVGGLTVLSGLRLYQKAVSANAAWATTRMGMTLGIGGAAAIIALLIGLIFTRPAGNRMAAVAREIESGGAPPTTEQLASLQTIRSRLMGSSHAVATFMLIAIVCMAIARYVG